MGGGGGGGGGGVHAQTSIHCFRNEKNPKTSDKHMMTRDGFPYHRYVSRKAKRIADSINCFLAFTSFKTEPH